MSAIPGTGGLLVYDQNSEFASSGLANLPGMEQVPKGMNYHPIVVFSGGKASKVVGYVQAVGRIAPTDPAGNEDDTTIDPVGEATVFFASADKSQVNKWAKKFGLQDSGQKDSSNGSSLFTAVPKPTQTPNGVSPSAPNTGAQPPDPQQGGAGGAAGGPGNYGGASSAVGNLNAAPNLGAARDANSVDTSKLMVTVDNPDISKLSPDELGRINALGGGVQPQQSSIQSQVDAVFGLTTAQQADLYKKLAAAGYKPSGTGLYDLAKAYEGALLDLNQMETLPSVGGGGAGNEYLSVDQFLAQQAQAQKTGQATTQSRSDTTINLTDPNAARGLVTSAIAQALGRNPTADEISQFTASLQAAEKASPNVTNTTATTGPDGNSTSQSSTSSGGFSSPDAYAQQWVEQNMPGQVHAAQIGTSLFNIIASAMNGNTS